MLFHNPISISSQNKKVESPEDLVFSGGGIKGIAYCGSIAALAKLNKFSGIKRYAGASAGAITAFLLAIGMSPEEIKNQMDNVDFSTFLQKSNVDIQKLVENPKQLLDPITGAKFILDEVEHKGMCDVSVFYNWLVDMLKTKDFSEQTTFMDLYQKTGKELFIAICNANYCKTVIANHINTPQMPVALAVRGSMSIPFVFQPLLWENNVYIDGGTMYNYPLEVFDSYTDPDKTLGFILSTEDSVLHPLPKPDDNIIQHVERFFECVMNVSYEYCFRLGNQYRSIFIDTAGITTLEFNLSNEQKQTLYENGYNATLEYFNLS